MKHYNILGIRHHGVGSGKMVQKRLEELQPDMIMIEGPPEIDSVLNFIGNPGLIPPVSIMIYDGKDSKKSSFYPYAAFSPEWIAAKYANTNKIPLRSIDLPAKISLNTNFRKDQKPILKEKDLDEEGNPKPLEVPRFKDAMSYLAEVAGYKDSEKWWDQQFEMAKDDNAKEHFEAVMLAMESLREFDLPSSLDAENVYREAYMRMLIRTAQNEMYENIVVICGAWHAPALRDIDDKNKEDTKLLKKLPKPRNKIVASWIPWTNGRLSMYSGYGAGITSPGWYEHLSSRKENTEIAWLTRVAELFRKEGQDMSSAHVIESYKLAISLCQLRNKSTISLDELNESVLTVMCMGDGILLELVKKEMIVGEKIGEVPDDIPKVPLQEDFEKTTKTLRLKLSAAPKERVINLRLEHDKKQSALFYRLNLLNIPWATPKAPRTKGTFKEIWELLWSPEMMIALIDNSYLGNTLELAARKKVDIICENENKISNVVKLLEKARFADLDQSVDKLLNKIDELSSISSDIQDIMFILPNLIEIKRYGDVRKSDFTILETITNRLLTKIFINLPMASYGLDDANSNKLFELISKVQNALKINDEDDILNEWHDSLTKVMNQDGTHHIIRGCVCRLLLDADRLTEEESTKKISFALSAANQPNDVASWVEGFLRGSGMILIYDNRLWNLLYQWVENLNKEQFLNLLPYLRRAFSKFEYGERRQIGAKAKKGLANETVIEINDDDFDKEKALPILDTISYLMGNK